MNITRRYFMKKSLAGTAAAIAFPTILPSSIFGKNSPNNKIHIAQIGCGRIARSMDLIGVLNHHKIAQIVAVCDVDSKRAADAKKQVEDYYGKEALAKTDVKVYGDFREILKDKSIDAVSISTPDHWHAEPVIAAALAGKDIYVQKPLTMTLMEGRLVSDIVRKNKRAFQIGSQQRSSTQFRLACELVRNGRIGTLRKVEIGLPTDPGGEDEPEMPVPGNLDYDMWLGPAPKVPYTEKRVHPPNDYSRPGWLRIEEYCLGMITGWGSHHVDIAQWGMGTELTGPLTLEGRAEFPATGLWNVHGPYHVEAKYANGVEMIIDNNFTNGVRFEGSEGWIFVSRGSAKAGASDPASAFGKALEASNPKILNTPIGASDIHLHNSDDHHLDWLTSIQTRKPAVTTPEQAHRSTSACILSWIAMKLGRKIEWDPAKEIFINDDQANAMRSRAERAPYGAERLARKA